MKPYLAFFLICAGATPAAAHAFLQHGEPSAGATLKSAPREVKLQFSEELESGFSGVEVTDASAHTVEAAGATVSGSSVHVPLKALAPGQYRVKWRAVSVDGHRTEGQYTFTVRP